MASLVKVVSLHRNLAQTLHSFCRQTPFRLFGSRLASTSSTSRKKENKRLRIELAASYRAFDRLNLGEGVCNHLSAVAPAADGSENDILLLAPYGAHWSEVTPSMLVGVNENNDVVEGSGQPEITAVCIHQGARVLNKHTAVMHLHSPYATALGCCQDPTLLMSHQNAMRFHNDIAYDLEFDGFGSSTEEGERLGKMLGNKHILMMGNHGALSASSTVAMAFDSLYYLERVAMFQMIAQSTGKPLRIIGDDVIKNSEPYLGENMQIYAKQHLMFYVRDLAKRDKEFSEHPDL